MDPVGVGIGVVSLTFQLFSGCVKGYQLLSEAKGMPREFQYLRVRLKTEQYRLLDWAEVANLDEQDEGLLISNHSKGLLIDVLDQQKQALDRFGRIDERHQALRHPLVSDMPADTNVEPTSPDEEPRMSLERADTTFEGRFPRSQKLLTKSLAWAQSARTYPRRLQWASWDKQKVETLIIKLTALNDFMRELLNHNQLQLLQSRQVRTEYQIMQLNGKVDHLLQIFESAMHMQSASVRGPLDPLGLFLQTRGLANIAQDRIPRESKMHNLAALAQIKALNSAIEDDSVLTDSFARDLQLTNTASQIRDVELPRRDITILDNELNDDPLESHRVEAYYTFPSTSSSSRRGKQQVWVEWKTYDPQNFNGGPDAKVQERIRQLAILLKENNRTEQFRAPHCLGYFRDVDPSAEDDSCRFGLVFEKPHGVHPSTRPTSLLDLLRHAQADMPSLTDRITLMTRIAECLERLHAVNWLHKGLRSANILFFSEHPVGADVLDGIDFAQPYVSGFDYSRPAANEDMTEKPPENAAHDLYRHPRTQGSGNRDAVPVANGPTYQTGGFKKSYDLYALGIILLEIAYWKPIDQILGIPNVQNARPNTTLKVRNRLLSETEDFLRFVKSHLGNTVEAVVKSCIVGPTAFNIMENEDERKEEVGARLQRAFFDMVVEKLQHMKV
ncbi:hypothetical protein EJ05DRAFT_262959 [Pseudovirgaria hyperparasitica]|uniref:Protein kinase domain-containing protein n=1 Tax=Pseudovirgaria hyperparasitica TaxID=470096 RepID=A0A6A6WH37_9PEZI|nr:uncharacterized protein EJ05DRAFT_262959 [Pseudovirgaria hyperparasitica]KAF2761380.1 hypothetical protein EJ05DRAFT_262959 [Pseudovirgaria hyperparasitica]